jgi:hypothetical protein
MEKPDVQAFLEMAQQEANAADRMSSFLNAVQIILLILIVVATFVSTISVAAELMTKTKRAILAGVPGLCAGLLAVVNPRVDWHRSKEIELNAVVSAVRYQGLELSSASAQYWSIRRGMEVSWQKAKEPEPTSDPSAHDSRPQPVSASSGL